MYEAREKLKLKKKKNIEKKEKKRRNARISSKIELITRLYITVTG